MMHLRRLFLLLFLAVTSVVEAQHSFLTLHEDYYHLVDRYAILNSDSTSLCTSIKPFQRTIFKDNFISGNNAKEEFNKLVFLKDNWDVLEKEKANLLLTKRTKWENFFPISGSFFAVNQPDFKLVVNPVLGFSLGKSNDDNIYRNTRGAEIRGSIGNSVGFYSFVSENQFRYPDYFTQQVVETQVVPGTGFLKTFGSNGYDFLNARGYIAVQANPYIHVQFGHDKNFIGNGYRSLILSDFAKENLFLKFRTQVWRINFMNLFMEMTDFQNTGINGLRKKYSAFHYLNINVIPGKLDVGFFENIVFARNDSTQQPGFEFNYLNPIIFYRAVEHGLNSSDNSLLGMDWKWNIKRQLSFYGQFILDEFHKNELVNRTKSWVNKWGFQAGLKYLNVAGINNLDLQIETNIVRPYVYSHLKKDQTWTHFNQPMAHPLGANFKEYIGILRYQASPKLTLTGKYFHIIHGADSSLQESTTHFGGNILTTYLNRPKDDDISIGDGLTQQISLLDFKASYQIYQSTFIDFRFILRKAERESPLQAFDNTIITAGVRMNISSLRMDY